MSVFKRKEKDPQMAYSGLKLKKIVPKHIPPRDEFGRFIIEEEKPKEKKRRVL